MRHLERCLAEAWPSPRWHDVTVLLAVSGGPDSVALARAVAALGPPTAGRVLLAHYNHALRGAESDVDERFVVDLATQLGWQCQVGRATNHGAGAESGTSQDRRHSSAGTIADSEGSNELQHAPAAPTSEECSRAARYDFLRGTAQLCGARYVVTAHTADDQAETVLHHIVRGTGLTGLAGMARARELAPGIALVRPLLAVRRADVLAYLTEIEQGYRVDSSNLDHGYTRNRLRHELLPQLAAQYNPRIVDSLLRLAALAGEASTALEPQVSKLVAQCVLAADASQINIDTAPLVAASRYLVREALIAAWRTQGWPLQGMGFEEWELLATLASEPAGGNRIAKRMLPGEILAERTGERLILSRAAG